MPWQSALTAFFLVFLFLALVIPDRLEWITARSLMFFPLELVLLACVLLLPGLWGRIIAALAALLLALGLSLKVASLISYKIFSRPFSPLLDAYLLVDGFDLLHRSIGLFGAILIVMALLLALAGIAVLSWLAVFRLRRLLVEQRRAATIVVASSAAFAGALALAPWHLTTTYFSDQLADHFRLSRQALVELRQFNEELENSAAYTTTQTEGLLARLKGKDVLLVFVESYGRTVLSLPKFDRHVRPLLYKSEEQLAAAGFSARSAFLTSPTVGGISWLAHSTVLSGLWIDNQIRYEGLTASHWPTLNQQFRDAGWRTVAVMPAIKKRWPEGDYFGYDKIYAKKDLDYQGLPFDWVTMPDQFTISAFHRRERAAAERAPVMAEIALISSHTPWAPLPSMVDWQQVGDGSVFDEQVKTGEQPEQVWQDSERVRLQYRRSIEYALQNLVSYVTTYGDKDLVMVILGDHQPAPLVTGLTDNRDVPVHLIASDPAVLEAIEPWQWHEGMVPKDSAPVWRMDQLRGRMVEAFSAPVSPNTEDASLSAAARLPSNAASVLEPPEQTQPAL